MCGGDRDAARSVGVPVVDLGCFQLRNVTEPVALFHVELVPLPEAVSIDPVRRMQVAHATAAGRLSHGDSERWFCSLACVGAFVEDPARHASKP